MAEINKAKEYLMQLRTLDNQLINKCEEVQKLEDMLTSINAASGDADKVKSSISQDKFGDTVAKIVDLQNEIKEEVNTLVEKTDEIKNVINKVEDQDLRNLLYQRYILGHKWEKIAVNMHLSYRHTLRLHGLGLQEIEKLIICH